MYSIRSLWGTEKGTMENTTGSTTESIMGNIMETMGNKAVQCEPDCVLLCFIEKTLNSIGM